jgi:hypothetical protein
MEAAVICTHTPSWVRPGTDHSKIHISAGRTREVPLVMLPMLLFSPP